MTTVFLSVVSLLDPYYPLVKKVNSFAELTLQDISPFCSASLSQEVLHLQKLYALSGKKRSCGNPSFVHSLRCFIWAQALRLPPKTARIVLAHDIVEDFGKSYAELRAMLAKMPVDLQKEIYLLTNQYKIVAQELAPYTSTTTMKKKLVTFYHEDDDVAKKIFTLLGNLPESINPHTYLQDNAYRLYIEDILESGNESVLLTKFIDRLDNTLADLPSKFETILKLYDKNLLLLTLSAQQVATTKNKTLQLLYLMLYERFMDQSTALRKRYDYIAKVRGKFYGKQYSQLSRDLRSRHQELEKITPFAEKLYASKILQRHIASLL